MSEATRTRTHAPEVRQRAVEILQEGVGHRALAAKLGIPQATARQWARAYAACSARAPIAAIGGASPLCSKADTPLPRTPKTPQLTENLPPLLLN